MAPPLEHRNPGHCARVTTRPLPAELVVRSLTLPSARGQVVLSLETTDSREVVSAFCHWDPDARRLEIGQVSVAAEDEGHGYGTELVRRLMDRHSDVILSQSPQSNLPKGDRWIASLRRRGLMVHDHGCYRAGAGCVCPCGVTG